MKTVTRPAYTRGRMPAPGSGLTYAPDAILLTPWSHPLVGAEAIERYEAGLSVAFPGAEIAVTCKVAGAGIAAVEWEFRGTHAGPLVAPFGVVAATHRPLLLRGAAFLKLDVRGRVVEEHRYYDVGAVLEQLGIPAP